jgi:hypothetical protein
VSVFDEMVSEGEASRTLEWHRLAEKAGVLRRGGDGNFCGWPWWSGGGRVVWRPPQSLAVYKVQFDVTEYFNVSEHDNMSWWHCKGFAWAPETQLYYVDRPYAPVLAMPYYPDPITSEAEIPETVYAAGVGDISRNFRRRGDGQVMLIDAGESGPR